MAAAARLSVLDVIAPGFGIDSLRRTPLAMACPGVPPVGVYDPAGRTYADDLMAVEEGE